MKLGLNIVGNGAHAAGWRMPGARTDAAMDIRLWKQMAQAAERACIHFMFWADGIAVRHSARDDDELSYNPRIDVYEPLTLIGALAAVTQRIGFLASASTTYNEPYHVARKFASLDYISEGRVGWNVVTSWSEQEAFNFGRDAHMEHALRYRRAEEFVDVVFGLWDSWEDDAFIRDKVSGHYFDPAKLHTLDHRGESFAVKGPLNVARPIQGYPVIAQAGSSGPGQDLGSRIADLIYTAQKTKEDAVAFYGSVKAHGLAAGRDPDTMLVMPGILPIMGRTRQDAQDRFDQLQNLVHPRVGLPMLIDTFGDLSGHDLDGPLPPPLDRHNAVKSAHEKLAKLGAQPGMTIRKLYQIMAGASGHNVVVGMPGDVADLMEDWFTNRACDGFNIMPAFMPGPAIEAFDWLVPELQRRGLFQTEYQGDGTMRGSLGLARRPFAAIAAAPNRKDTPNDPPLSPGFATTLFCAFALPGWAQTDAIPTQTPQPALVALLPPDTKTFTLAVALGSPPDDFRDAKGEVAGWEIDIMRAATQALGLQLDLRPTTFDTLIPGLQSKRFDGATGQMGITDAREKIIDMIGTLLGNELFASLSESSIKVNGLEDLCGLTVGTTRGSREMVFAEDQNPKCLAAGKKPINALAFSDGNGAAEALMSRRADLFWLGSTAVSYFVAQSKGRTKIVGSYTDTSYIGIGMPKGSELAKPLQAAVQVLIDNGTYGKIVTKWGLQDGAIKQAPLNPTGTPR